MDSNPDRDADRPKPDGQPTPLEWTLTATLVDETYKLYLGRPTRPDEVEYWLQTIRNGLAPTAFVDGVKNSEEARGRATQAQTVAAADARRLVGEPCDEDLTTLVAGLYRGFLGRSASVEELEFCAASGVPFVSIARGLRDSVEAQSAEVERQQFDLESAKVAVQLMFQVHLGRPPSDSECETWAGELAAGRRLESCVAEIASSAEAKSRLSEGPLSVGIAQSGLPGLDPESAKVAVQLMYKVHLGRGPRDSEYQTWAGELAAGRRLENCDAEIASSAEAKSFRLRRPNQR